MKSQYPYHNKASSIDGPLFAGGGITFVVAFHKSVCYHRSLVSVQCTLVQYKSHALRKESDLSHRFQSHKAFLLSLPSTHLEMLRKPSHPTFNLVHYPSPRFKPFLRTLSIVLIWIPHGKSGLLARDFHQPGERLYYSYQIFLNRLFL
ncbi:hypothetical protein AMTRI_Chr02g257170 [Amborella trichopoda]